MKSEVITRRVLLKNSALGTAWLVLSCSGIRAAAENCLIQASDIDGSFRSACGDAFFDPNNFDEIGIPSILPADDVVAGTWGTWTFEYEVGKNGMALGGGIRIIKPTGYVMWWSEMQSDDPGRPGFIEISADNPEVDLRIDGKWSPEWGKDGFSVKVAKGELKPGDKITAVWGRGDRVKVQHSALKNVPFRFTTDTEGDGIYRECFKTPTFSVLPDKFDHIRITARTDAQIGKPHRIHVACFDKWHNLTQPPVESVEINCSDTEAQYPRRLCFDSSSCSFQSTFRTEGRHKITIKLKNGAISVSNPILVHKRMPEYKILWGDIHGHSNHSDGAGTIDEYYSYSREAANLDFCSLTDHCSRVGSISDIEWKMMQDAVKNYNKPGEFVTLLGYEYTAMSQGKKLGHRNVYYLDEKGPIYRFMEPAYDTYAKVWNQLRENRTKAMTISHHPLAARFAQNWDYFDSEFERLVEIYSYHGNSEYHGCPRQCDRSGGDSGGSSVVDALKRGYKLGFIGAGDNHQCRPGYGFTEANTGGFTVVYARDLTRKSIWEALMSRRCYATSVRGIVVEFSINGAHMGSEVRDTGPRKISGSVKGTGPLDYVRIIKNGELWREVSCLETDFIDISVKDEKSSDRTDFYYLRIGQKDGHLAWSSPIWIGS